MCPEEPWAGAHQTRRKRSGRRQAGQLADGALYATDLAKAAQLATRHDEIEMELLEALERWEVLEAIFKGEAQ